VVKKHASYGMIRGYNH